MKTSTSHISIKAAGFTLLEIITVIAIIMVLAAMTVGGMSYYKDKTSRSKTMVLMASIENALEQYHADTGEYPEERASNVEESTKILYRALYGDGIGPDGIAGTDDDVLEPQGFPDKDATIYMPQLDPNKKGSALNLQVKNGSVTYIIVDGWGEPMGYRCIPEGSTELMNSPSSFDLWSAGNEGTADQETPINNWK
jgi:type II secretory pathway pseudopilin PulG